MSLSEAAAAFVRLARAGSTSADEWRAAGDRFRAALEACGDPGEIERVLAADVVDDIPISLKSAAFERRLSVGPRAPEVLRAYADHLYLHGPDWDELAQALNDEADRAAS